MLHHDVRRDLVHNIHCIVIYISCYEYELSLKIAFIVETCCWWLLIDKLVFRRKLRLFYLLGYLNTSRMPCLKIISWDFYVISRVERNRKGAQNVSLSDGWRSFAWHLCRVCPDPISVLRCGEIPSVNCFRDLRQAKSVGTRHCTEQNLRLVLHIFTLAGIYHWLDVMLVVTSFWRNVTSPSQPLLNSVIKFQDFS